MKLWFQNSSVWLCIFKIHRPVWLCISCNFLYNLISGHLHIWDCEYRCAGLLYNMTVQYKCIFQKKIRCLWIPWVSAGGFWGEMAADSGKMDSTESQFNNTSTISHHHHHHLVRFQIFLWCLIFFLWCLSQNTAGDKGQDGFNRISIQQHSPA